MVLFAALVHWLAVAYAPQLAMRMAFARFAEGGSNTIVHVPRATAAFHRAPKPSPDLFYSTCAYDVSEGPVKITTPAPAGTYWSVAFIDANTDNFYVLNDTTANERRATIVLARADQSVPPLPKGTLLVRTLTSTGAVLFRILINDDKREAELDAQRRTARCELLN
jgi:uncharacterized membrane protein